MKKTRLLFVLLIVMVIARTGFGQQMARLVTLRYSDERLGKVLADISSVYEVRFTYSSNFIPVDQRVNVEVVEEPLSVALDNLFEQTTVVYASIGGQVVLKVDKKKSFNELSKLESSLPMKIRQTSPIYPNPLQDDRLVNRRQGKKNRHLSPIQKPDIKKLPGGERYFELEMDKYKLPPVDFEEDDTRLGQISLLPFLGTNALKSDELTNNLSLNLMWGSNGGVEGVEVGGFVNTIKYDVKGIQVAGLGNTVGGKIIGTQVAGLFNVGRGKMQGVQVAGLFNVSGPADAVQVAALFNVANGGFAGIQAAGLFNVSGGKAEGVQAALVFNHSKGKTKTQLSALFNRAGDVEYGQISFLLNIAKKVDGFQIGIINVADTITGIPIGLLNIIKKGYNRVEFSAGETLFANFAVKLGARSFYNIFHLGARWDDLITSNGSITQSGIFMSWGLGYGIGTAIRLSPRTLINVEALAIHINEAEAWTKKLNLLNQLKLQLDFRTGKRTSLFAGPSGNIMLSKLYDPESGEYGSKITPAAFYDETKEGTNVKMWLGFNAGVRF